MISDRAPTGDGFGLYVHVPYCRALCHYCDFAKTANYGQDHLTAYIAGLVDHTRAWLSLLGEQGLEPRFSSVFFGGGTPSLMTDAYAPFFALIGPYLAAACEISLEANPDDVDERSLRAWRSLGINRLSVGVQTFDQRGLDFMKRLHDGKGAAAALELAAKVMPSVNADLIYGWPGQTTGGFEADLARALELGASHLSLYNLTYEERTPIGRAYHRGMLAAQPDEQLYDFYAAARVRLALAGFEQEEVSNWCKPGHACRHNQLYWTDSPYLGIGAGAHGYLPSADELGWRYQYPRSDRQFLKHDLALGFGIESEVTRKADDWLLEYVGCGLRCFAGVDLARAARLTGLSFRPRPLVAEAMDDGTLQLGADGRLRLTPDEWFRETAWSLELILSFGPSKP